MAEYILECKHPFKVDTEEDMDKEYFEIVYKQVQHEFPADNDVAAGVWVDKHAKEKVSCRKESANPEPLRLVKIVRSWGSEMNINQ